MGLRQSVPMQAVPAMHAFEGRFALHKALPSQANPIAIGLGIRPNPSSRAIGSPVSNQGTGRFLSMKWCLLVCLVLRAVAEDRTAWFSPPPTLPLPEVRDAAWARSPVDRFVLARLEAAGLRPSPEAPRRVWLRRVTLDLTGLPPESEDMEGFLADTRSDAFERVVDRLLGSPRYGERWAQHWLDVVRYADTHGFEVNTERPNAWPYRDYVIGALNRDLPYGQFIREQLAGDSLGNDAATGFLVTASVLLPGQIGADDVSKRLARQDSLDEIVVNTGQTFLGLSIGCARCHDHKFDPISSRDYYAMQAFFAGVEYEEREIHGRESEEGRLELERCRKELAMVEQELSRFEPVARPGSERVRRTDSRTNREAFAPKTARFLRFAIQDVNQHPTLGVIEPCLDEVEILTDEVPPRNVALGSAGTRVTASGSRSSERHRLEHVNDGRYGNDHSWMSDEPGRGWLLFEFPSPVRVASVLWSRDREGQFTDRTPTAFSIEVGASVDSLETVAMVPARRPAVSAMQNSDRISPVSTRHLRFTILDSGSLEPCLDELEVWDATGRNVALASHGTIASSSGDTLVPGRHSLAGLNDGVYGNDHSWMSREPGKGWVELTFPQAETIERIHWGRDREGKFSDRLAIKYRIEIQDREGRWRCVADESDRRESRDATGQTRAIEVPLAGLPPDAAREVVGLGKKRKDLESRIETLSASQRAFAGVFRKPDAIRRLRRGDPEQPMEPVSPAVPAVLGTLTLPDDAAEAERRLALANWMARPDHPLTTRVLVNRIWQGHFGTGIVETPSDFGRNGARPSHPELLDWLATELVRRGGSIKALHRLLVLSATYRQSVEDSRSTAKGMALDAGDRLLWHFPSRRLESEVIRDSMLWVSGRLDFKAGGRGFDLFNQRGGLSGFKPVESYRGDGLRRMIYAHKVRREREAVFGAFDCPDAGQSTARRRESTTPLQALNLFNSRFTLEASEALAERVGEESGRNTQAAVRKAYQLALSRPPDPEEEAEAVTFIQSHGLPGFCRALFNCNEFLVYP